MRALFLTQYDRNGPSSRIRVYQFISFLEDLGIECKVEPLLTGAVKELIAKLFSSADLIQKVFVCLKIFLAFISRYGHVLKAGRYSVVVVQKDVLPFGLFSILKLINPRIIFEFDDAIWEPTPGEKKKTGLMKLVFKYRSYLLKNILTKSAAILAENSYLEKYAKKYNRDVTVIAAPIDLRKYKRSEGVGENDITIGWIGSPSTTYLLESIRAPLNQIVHKHNNVKIVNLGGAPILSNSPRFNNVTWAEDSEVSELQKFDIGLMPLDDTPFNKGRLGYKIIIYLSMGIPTVASKIGLNCEVIDDGVDGILVSSPGEWVKALEKLIINSKLRKEMGKKARQTAQEKYDIQKCAIRYKELLQRVACEKL